MAHFALEDFVSESHKKIRNMGLLEISKIKESFSLMAYSNDYILEINPLDTTST